MCTTLRPERRLAPASMGGFTLVELLVVLVILAMMLGMALPYLGKSLAGTAERAAIAELRVALRAAGDEAVTHGRTVTFRTEPDGGYWIGRRHARPPGEIRVAVAGNGHIAFYPWGGSSGGRLLVEGPNGRRQIVVDVITGRAALAP